MSRKIFTPPQPSPNPRGGSKKFTNDLGLLYTFSKSLVQDRPLLDKSQLLYAYLGEQPSHGTYTINLPSDQGIGRTAIVETSS